MDDILNIGEWADDASSKTIEIYSLYVKKTVLEDADRTELKKERGFTDEMIDLCQFKSCRPENREVIKELQDQFGEDALLEAGLLVAADDGIKPAGALLGIYNADKKFVNNICIPYFNQDGEIFYIRPHKLGLKDQGINIYCPARNVGSDKTWVIAESEFKAAAALQYGYPAIGLPGIHSFAVNNFERLKEFVVAQNISNIVIVFDNEIKTNPQFKNFKPNVLKQWDTQWRAIDMCRKLLKQIPELNSVKVGVLPESWMVEGKIDIDGALSQGRSSAEFKSVIIRAVDWNAYLDVLPASGRKIIAKRIYREDFLEKNKVKKKDTGYYVERTKKVGREENLITTEENVSNFTMDIKKTLVEGSNHIREVVFRGQDGSLSKPFVSHKGDNILREFKSWVWTCGDYHFTGKQEDLDLIWKLEGALSDGRVIYRPEQIGYLKSGSEEPCWLFGNVLLKEDGNYLIPDSEGIIWDGLSGYLPRSIKEETSSGSTTAATTSKMPTINLNSEISFALPELKQAIEKMEKIYNTKAVLLGVGWIISCLFSEEIHKKYQCFPILFIGGKREAGKTTLGNWLMAMAGQNDTAGDSLGGTSPAGAERNLAWFGSLPYWLDEYRNDAKTKRWDGFLRNAYQRQAPSKGTLGTSIRSNSINAGIMLSGEETPSDNALLTRCIVISLANRKQRAGNDAFNIASFKEIEALRTQGLLSRLILEIVKMKKKLLPTVLDYIDGWKSRLLSAGVGDRLALNYAIAAVCYDLIFLKDESLAVRQEFARWVVEESHKSEKEKENEHMLAVFMEDIITIHGQKVGDKYAFDGYFDVYSCPTAAKGKKRIALHFPTFYSKWADHVRRKGMEPFKKGTIQSYIRDEPYFIEDNYLKRVKGKSIRTLVLSLDETDGTPDGIKFLATGAIESESDEGIAAAVGAVNEDDEKEDKELPY